jgi:competence protein ComEA
VEPAAEWRLIEPDDEATAPSGPPKDLPTEDRVPRGLIAAIVGIVACAVAVAIWATLPTGSAAVESSAAPFAPRGVVDIVTRTPGSSLALGGAAATTLVVDVEGAVAQPGLHELSDGSRVGDAIAAAGGYAPAVDIDVASRVLNLAAKLTDGQQIHVPALGENVAPSFGGPIAGGTDSPAAGGLIDLNHATAEELDTLPGVGPVTAAKIIDARTQAPFATVDELETRGVVGTATLEKLRALVTVTP